MSHQQASKRPPPQIEQVSIYMNTTTDPRSAGLPSDEHKTDPVRPADDSVAS
jgi:hypothetical protein